MQKRYYVLMVFLVALFLSCGLVATQLPTGAATMPVRLIPWGVAWDYQEERDVGLKHPMICEGERTWTVWEGTISGGGCFVRVDRPVDAPKGIPRDAFGAGTTVVPIRPPDDR